MRSKRVILIAAIALIAAGSVFGVALWAARSDSRPFDDGIVATELAPAEDWTLPESVELVAEGKPTPGFHRINVKDTDLVGFITDPRFIVADDTEAQMEFQFATLQARDGAQGMVTSPPLWTPVEAKSSWRDSSLVRGDGFANRSVRAIVGQIRDRRVGIRLWNARGNAYQEIHLKIETDAQWAQCFDLAERWRVPEFDDEADLKAKWEAFVVRARGK